MGKGRLIALPILTVVLGLGPTAPARAETYPTRAIRIVVPYAAGGVNDVTARLLQPGLQHTLGQPIVIDNRSGANGVIGSALVVKAPPDGYTLLIDNEFHAVNPAINPKLPFDPARELAPITLICTISRLFVINDATPARSLAEFVALAKAQPGRLNYAIAASPVQLAMELFDEMAGIQITSVIYRGGAPAMQAMLTNETQITLVPLAPAASYLKAGQLRALAIAGPQRSPALPDVPTVAEAGYPQFEAPSWIGLLAPAETPRAIIDRLHEAIAETLATPEIMQRFAALGLDVAAWPPDKFRGLVAREIAQWTKVAHDHNIVVEE